MFEALKLPFKPFTANTAFYLIVQTMLLAILIPGDLHSQAEKVLELGETNGGRYDLRDNFIVGDFLITGNRYSTYIHSLTTGQFVEKKEDLRIINVFNLNSQDLLLAANVEADSIGFYTVNSEGLELLFNFSQDTNHNASFKPINESGDSILVFVNGALWITDGSDLGTREIYRNNATGMGNFSVTGNTLIHFFQPYFVYKYSFSEDTSITYDTRTLVDSSFYPIILQYPIDGRYFLVELRDSSNDEEFGIGLIDVFDWDFTVLSTPDNQEFHRRYSGNYFRRHLKIGNKIYFFFEEQQAYKEYRTLVLEIDLDSEKIQFVSDLAAPIHSGKWPRFHEVNDRLLVFGVLGPYGAEPYYLDGSGVRVLKDIYPGFGSSIEDMENQLFYSNINVWWDDVPFEKLGSEAFFVANHKNFGRSVFKTDGTPEGTTLIANPAKGSRSLGDSRLIKSTNNQLFLIHKPTFDALEVFKIPIVSQVPDPVENENEWNIRFGLGINDFTSLSGEYEKFAKTYVKDNGDFIVYQQGIDPSFLWANQDGFDTIGALAITGFSNERSVIHFFDSNGSVKNQISLICHDSRSELGVDPKTGKVVLAYQKDHDIGFIGKERLESGKYFMLTGLNEKGERQWERLFPNQEVAPGKVILHDHKIYISGWYFGRQVRFGALTANSVISPQPFTAAFSQDGEPIWIKNVEIDSFRYWSNLNNIVIDSANGLLISLFNESGYSWRSSCGFSDWHYVIQANDIHTGDSIWQIQFKTGGLSRFPTLSKLSNGDLVVGGDITSSLEIKNKEFVPKRIESSCPQASVVFVIDPESGRLKEIRKDDGHENKYLRDILPTKNGYYTASILRKDSVHFYFRPRYRSEFQVQLDLWTNKGHLVGSKNFWLGRPNWDSRESDVSVDIEIGGQNSVLLNTSFNQEWQTGFDTLFSFPAEFLTHKSFVLSKRDGISFSDYDPESFFELNEKTAIIYPNPNFGPTLNFIFKKNGFNKFRRARLFNLSGEEIMDWDIEFTEIESSISWGRRPGPGLYILRLEGERTESFKIVVK